MTETEDQDEDTRRFEVGSRVNDPEARQVGTLASGSLRADSVVASAHAGLFTPQAQARQKRKRAPSTSDNGGDRQRTKRSCLETKDSA